MIAAQVLGQRREPAAEEPLRALVRDRDPFLAAQALHSLIAIVGVAALTGEVLEPLARSGAPAVNRVALRALRRARVIATGAQRSRRWAITAALATVGLTIAAGLVAIASRSPLSSSAPVNATSARAPITALFMVLAAAGIVVIVAIVALIWPRRGSDEPEFVYERPGVSWISKLIAILLPLALGAALVVAAIVGAHGAQRASGVGNASLVGTGSAGRLVDERPSAGGGFVLPGWLPYTVIAIVALAAALAIVVLLVRRQGHRRRATRQRRRQLRGRSGDRGARYGGRSPRRGDRCRIRRWRARLPRTESRARRPEAPRGIPRPPARGTRRRHRRRADSDGALRGGEVAAPIRSPSASASSRSPHCGNCALGWKAMVGGDADRRAGARLARRSRSRRRSVAAAAPRPDRARRGAAPI